MNEWLRQYQIKIDSSCYKILIFSKMTWLLNRKNRQNLLFQNFSLQCKKRKVANFSSTYKYINKTFGQRLSNQIIDCVHMYTYTYFDQKAFKKM